VIGIIAKILGDPAMPIYVYQAKKDGCDICRDNFEYKQSVKDDALKKCPDCGAGVQRVICAPFVQTGRSDKSVLSDNNLKKHGFEKLVNEGDGKFRRTLTDD
jgi:putative FmdB family regulatory protein